MNAKTQSHVEVAVNARSIVFRRKGDLRDYVWVADRQPLAFTDTRVSSVTVDDSSYDADDPWFIFFAEDCFSPLLHAIRAKSFEHAYMSFVDQEAERGHYVLDENASKEELERATYSEYGVPVNTESFMGFEVTLISADAHNLEGGDV